MQGMRESDREAEVASLANQTKECEFTHDTDLLKFEEESKLQGIPQLDDGMESDSALSERSAKQNLEAMGGQENFGYDE